MSIHDRVDHHGQTVARRAPAELAMHARDLRWSALGPRSRLWLRATLRSQAFLHAMAALAHCWGAPSCPHAFLAADEAPG